MSDNSRECDHKRGMFSSRSSAVTVCRCCRDYLCSICGVTIDWYDGLCVTNPVVQWRYCEKGACVEAEARYHTLPVGEMTQRRGELRGKRLLAHLQDREIEPRPRPRTSFGASFGPVHSWHSPGTLVTQATATPRAFVLDPGEACWCNLGKDCSGDHEIGLVEVINLCGFCGETFRTTDDDPHFSTGRGPLCPVRRQTGDATTRRRVDEQESDGDER